MSPELKVFNELPAGLLDCSAPALYTTLDGPTLIHLPGKDARPLFTAVLQHGNETVGWEAVRTLLRQYNGNDLPRSWSIFIANVVAARYGLRQLESQMDFNRSWPGSEEAPSSLQRLTREVTEVMRKRRPFASVDVHNNTGLNPHYGAVNVLRHDNLHLASLFSRTVLYFTTPKGIQSGAFADFCPAVTVECGQVGGAEGIEHAAQFLDACLNLSELPNKPLLPADLDLYRTVARVRVGENLSFGFDAENVQVNLAGDLDTLNFRPLPRGTRLARIAPQISYGVTARDPQGNDVTSDYFLLRGGELRIARPVMPSMLTRNETVIRQDCLCYLMEEIGSPP